MKTIGLLGGTGWSSTIGYYQTINKLVAKRLGGYHSANILLKSIDYHDIKVNYGKDDTKISEILKQALSDLIALKPDCFIICSNVLHKYYDIIKNDLGSPMPMFHAVDLVVDDVSNKNDKHVLLLATKFTMEDGFFADSLERKGIQVSLPSQEERDHMQTIHGSLMNNVVTEESRNYFRGLTKKYNHLDAVVLGCTEYPLVLDQTNSILPIINPVVLQATHAVDYALSVC